MDHIRKNIKGHYIISALALGGIAFVAFNFSGPPLFASLDNFVLFAQEVIELEKGVQVSSGDLGSNEKIDIEKDIIVNGNLFADRIILDKNTTINGNASFNKLKTEKETRILGTQTKPVSLPIANLPEIPDFQAGTQDFKFEGEDNTLATGNYRDIMIEKNSRLVLTGGVYNLRKLELKENSTFIFNASTIINVQFKLRGHDKVAILPGQSLKPDDLQINYFGIKLKKDKDEKEDDDQEIESELDDQEKEDRKKGKIGRPVVFGKNSFLNFKLLAPKAGVHIEKESTVRGQIVARKIKIGKDSILSREEVFVKESDPTKVVEDRGVKFLINEIVILFNDEATQSDIQKIADLVGGRITGLVSIPKIAKMEVQTATIQELNNKIQLIKDSNNPFVVEIIQNLIGR